MSCSGKIHRLPASRAASRTAATDRDVVGLVERARPEGVAEVAGERRSRAGAAGSPRPACGAAGRRTRRSPSGRPRNSTVVDADDARRLDLLGLAHPAALVGVHPVDAGLAAGHHHVDDLLALARPAGDGRGGAELHVVGVRDDRDGASTSLRAGTSRGSGSMATSMARKRVAGRPRVGQAAGVIVISRGRPRRRDDPPGLLGDRAGGGPRPTASTPILRTWERLRTLAQSPTSTTHARSWSPATATGWSAPPSRMLACRTTCTWPTSRSTCCPSGVARASAGRCTTRRWGASRADGRTSVCGEVYVPGGDGPATPAYDVRGRARLRDRAHARTT